MRIFKLVILSLVVILVGCSTTYTTPGGSVQLSDLADTNINELMSKEPAANFPVNFAVARVQASGYESYGTGSFGSGRYSVVTTREVEVDEDFERILNMPQVEGVAPLSRILLSTNLDSIAALREASARLRADILLIYTFDTAFHVGAQKFAPLNTISLGFLNNKEVTVTTTVSAAFFDVRTEFLYGLAESTITESKRASVWSKSAVVDDLRVNTERTAFQELLPAIESTWARILSEHAEKNIY